MTIIPANPETYLYLVVKVHGVKGESEDEIVVQAHQVLAWKIGEETAEATPVFIGGAAVNDLWFEDDQKHWFYKFDDDAYLAWDDDCNNYLSFEEMIKQVSSKLEKASA